MSETLATLGALLAQAKQLTLADAVAKRDEWRRQVSNCAVTEGSESWLFFWDSIRPIHTATTNMPDGVLVFVMFSCIPIYTKWVFAQPADVANRLIRAARPLIEALRADGTKDSLAIVEEIRLSVGWAITRNVANHPHAFPLILGKVPWSLERSRMHFGGVVECEGAEIFGKIETVDDLERLRVWVSENPPIRGGLRFLDLLVARLWNTVSAPLRDLWLNRVADRYVGGASTFLAFYVRARRDASWLQAAVEELERTMKRSFSDAQDVDRWCIEIQQFHRSLGGPRLLLEFLRREDLNASNAERFTRVLDLIWETRDPADDACLVSLLFHEIRLVEIDRDAGRTSYGSTERWKTVIERIESNPRMKPSFWIAERLAELHSASHYGSALARPEERLAWRREIGERLTGQTARDAMEALLWWSDGVGADEAEFTVLSLIRSEEDRDHLRAMFQHSSRIVQIRARAVDALLDGHEDARRRGDRSLRASSISAVLSAARDVVPASPTARTWIGDSTIEALIHTSVSRVERTFCAEYASQWGNDEERLVAHLLSNLEHAFADVAQLLRDVELHGLAHPVEVSLEYREPTKREEGDKGVGTETFAVDVAFIVRIESHGTLVTERATFLQCKKVEGSGASGDWKPSFVVSSPQLNDLIAQTESAFYLFLVPAFAREECWVVPARLVRNLMTLDGTKASLPRLRAANGSRSLATWLTFDLMGLWTGDERVEIVKKAQGNHPGRRPRFVVAITIRTGHDAGG